MSGRVHGKRVLITGASGELGGATAALLVREGAVVANLDRIATAPRDGVTDIVVDITDEADVVRAVAEAADVLGGIDVVVNAAGVMGRPAPSHEATIDEFDLLFDVNVKGTWLVTKHAVPHLRAAGGGSVVNFSSIHGITGGRNVPLYHATKGAVRLLTKSDAANLGVYGIRVNSIHPGSMRTAMSRRAAEESPVGAEEYYRQLVGGNPLPRQGEPIEVAYGVLYLASDESTFTTGSELVVDGGYTAL